MVIFDRKLKEYYECIFSLEGGQVSCCVNAGLAAVEYSVGASIRSGRYMPLSNPMWIGGGAGT